MVAGVETAARQATYEDLLKVPENLVAEIIDGELYATPRPAFPHARATSVMGSDLGGPFGRPPGGPGGWWMLDEPDLDLGPDVVVPDLAAWRRERMARPPSVRDEERKGHDIRAHLLQVYSISPESVG